ncbi:MAG: DUF1194 domain-containing protein [Pseudomonadota bacterium]
MRILAILLALGIWATSQVCRAEEVDLELVLAMDASGSISKSEYILQMQGTANAFRDPAIQAAIVSGPTGKIAVNVMLWSDAAFPKINSGWYVLDSPGKANAFAAIVQSFQLDENKSIGFGGGGTGIGAGVEEALRLLNNNRQKGLRRVIDVSGDGVETQFWFKKSVMMPDAKILANAENVTINGLPILSVDFPYLDEYYRNNVITGPGAFVETASDFDDFGRAIHRKLLREISSTIAGLDLSRDTVKIADKLFSDPFRN